METAKPTDPGGDRAPGLFAGAAALAAVAAALLAAFFPSLRALELVWHDPNFSHGYFVVPIALAIAWSRRDGLDAARLDPRWWGILPLLGLAGVRVWLYAKNEQYIEQATFPLFVAASALAVGGAHLVRVFWPAMVFLFFMMPLPPSINNVLAAPLQHVATLGSVALLQAAGMPVLNEGNVIIVGAERLEVARACNGLSMLLSFVTLIAAMVLLVRRPVFEQAILLASTVPIALIANILRIAATAWCYQRFGHEAGERIAHDWAGYLMMPTALGLVLLELKLLSWLVIVEAPRAAGRPRLVRQGS